MLSRRNIRIKVMQTLYSMDSEGSTAGSAEGEKTLLGRIEQSRKLFTYLTYFLTEVAFFAAKDATKKAGKYLPTADDLAVNTKISENSLALKIADDKSFQKALADMNLAHIIDQDLVRKIYDDLKVSGEYSEYIESAERNKKFEKKILEYIFNTLMLPNEAFTAHIEEHFINWDDDAEVMDQIVLNYLSKPVANAFLNFLCGEKLEFAKSLLRTVIEKKEVTLELITPKLKNWDADRIATLDLIILQMGVCEFLYFETIPTKVTINEYIDLAKDYSTQQSGQFINGLLDNIHKELTAENKIIKRVYKNSTI